MGREASVSILKYGIQCFKPRLCRALCVSFSVFRSAGVACRVAGALRSAPCGVALPLAPAPRQQCAQKPTRGRRYDSRYMWRGSTRTQFSTVL